MELETFFEQFELLADAPNGVQKLRELILQLAVQGKLVPQDANDEPASVLLERIREEKKRLIKEGKIKKGKELPPVDADEMPCKLSHGWSWERLGNLANFIDYRGKTPQKTSSGIRLITAKNVRMGFIKLEPREYISEESYKEWMTRGFPKYGDLLFTTEAPLGNVAQLLATEKIALAQRVINFQLFADLLPEYLKFALMSPFMQNCILEKATGTTAKGIKSSKLQLILIPLPPLSEQHRIVAKVDRLMSFCDELEARQQKRHKHILQLGEVATSQLITPSTPEAFNQHWQSICDNFDLLYSTPENVSQLRQAILQLAVMGKLVPQDANDEPASVLLERIREEKKRLVKEGKIKKQKELPPIDVDEMAFELPDGWEWVRLGEICFFIGGYAFKSSSYVKKSNNQLIRLGNVKNDQIILEKNPAYIPDNIALMNHNFLLYIGDILVTMTGTRNKRDYCFTTVIEPQYLNGTNLYLNQRVGCLRVYQGIVNKLVNIFLKSSSILDLLFLSETGTANQGNIGANALNDLPFPLPPLAEQHRIVAKVDRLMSLCDELEAKLTQSISDREKLMETAVRQVLVA